MDTRKFHKTIKDAVTPEDQKRFLEEDSCHICGAGDCKTYFLDKNNREMMHFYKFCERVVCEKCHEDLKISNFITHKIIVPLIKLKRMFGL